MSESLPLKEQFDWVCSLVAHEDDLISVRTNWALVFHGLLFTSYVSGVGLYEKLSFNNSCFDPIAVGLLLVCFLGLGSALAAWHGVRAAEKQLKVITDWWKYTRLKVECSECDSVYPSIYIHSDGKWPGASTYFIFLGVAWVVLGGLIVCAPELLISIN